MTLLPRALSLCIPLCRASLSVCNDTTTSTLDVTDCPSYGNTRTLWDIVLSCALTLFACTWTAFHPNIPGIEEGIIAVTSRRLFLMIMALIAPELMITWSSRQFFSAHDAAKFFRSFGEKLQQDAQTRGRGRNTREDDGHNAGEEDTTTLLPRCLQLHERNSPESSPSRARDVQALGSILTHRFFAWMDRFLPYRNNTKEGKNQFQGWTSTHGFFAWMGGFLLYEDNKPRATLTPDELVSLIRKKLVDIPIIAEEDIEDRSKGDVLSKGIAILQLAWFIVQLAARYAEKLPISLLEIDTLAVAGLTYIAYGMWWKKPKDVGRPYIVYLKATPRTSWPDRLRYDQENLADIGEKFYFPYLFYPFLSLTGTRPVISQSDVDSHRAPFLGGYTTEVRGGTVCLIGCTSGMLFGGIHCLGWNFVFEGQMAWRVASISIFCAPIYTLIFYGVSAVLVNWGRDRDWNHNLDPVRLEVWDQVQDRPSHRDWNDGKYHLQDFFQQFIFVMFIISAIVYVIARIGLIVLMFMSLRSLPLGAYDTVAWTKFIPHYH